jgi:hypothetical protein
MMISLLGFQIARSDGAVEVARPMNFRARSQYGVAKWHLNCSN